MQTSDKRGFTLVEVMASVAILGIGLVSLVLAVNRAKETAYITRNIKAVRNLATNLLAEIENGKFERLYDGMTGNFASAGYPEFEFQIGVGEDTAVSAASEDLRTDDERRRDELKRQETSSDSSSSSTDGSTTDGTNNASTTNSNEIQYEQVTLRVTFKTLSEEPTAFVLIKKMPKEIVEGNFEDFKARLTNSTTTSTGMGNASTSTNEQPK